MNLRRALQELNRFLVPSTAKTIEGPIHNFAGSSRFVGVPSQRRRCEFEAEYHFDSR